MYKLKSRFCSICRGFNSSFKKKVADEDGGATILSLFLFIMILGICGMSIDFMRLKDKQATIQDLADRAAVAAANLYSPHDPAEIVESYFEKADALSSLSGSPIVVDEGSYRQVTVNTEIGLNTFFLHLVGIDELSTEISSTAIQGVGDVEISLVMDVSASMYWDDSIADLRAAAIAFAEAALHEDNAGQVSLNVIAFAGNVNIGPDMFDYLQGVAYGEPQIAGASTAATDDDAFYPNISTCLDIPDADFNDAGLPSYGLPQAAHFLSTNKGVNEMDAPHWCPLDDMQIRYAANELGDINDTDSLHYFLSNLDLSFGTGTHFGAKMGLALLDPSTQPAFSFLSGRGVVPSEFSSRPLPYGQIGVQKMMVIMTDGAIAYTAAPNDYLDPDNLELPLLSGSHKANRVILSTKNNNRDLLESVCDLSKETSRNVEVFTVAFEANSTAEVQMEACASSSSHFYSAAGDELTSVFTQIANQISSLRITE